MRREITIGIKPEPDLQKETACLSLHFEGQAGDANLDVSGRSLLKVSRTVPDLAQDFLCIAACVYAADKAVSRNDEEDKWTREIAIEIPVEHEATWNAIASELSECIGFLTGDYWTISFRHAERRLIQKKPRIRKVRYKKPSGKAVCLFSGGLDSFIGAVDWMNENSGERVLLVGHYDQHVGGPGVDQRALRDVCQTKYPTRFDFAQTQVGLSSGGQDTNFRSRSLLFIALGCYFAEILGEGTPVLIPENGPIALNFPLTPARRGSCSTRTVHPHFIAGLNRILKSAGMSIPVRNPYEFKTKGEMVEGCLDQTLLARSYSLTRSCAKHNRRQFWANRKARGCGICVPCLFRRAALSRNGQDDEIYGNDIAAVTSIENTPTDLLALLAFLRKAYSDRDLAAGLLGNGPLLMTQLTEYVELMKRMRAEVITWLRTAGSPFLKSELRAC